MGFENGGLVVAPAGAVDDCVANRLAFREAIAHADLAIADSGWMVLFWRILRGEKLTRISGLKFFNAFWNYRKSIEPGNLFWVLPSETAKEKTLAGRSRKFSPHDRRSLCRPALPVGTPLPCRDSAGMKDLRHNLRLADAAPVPPSRYKSSRSFCSAVQNISSSPSAAVCRTRSAII